MSDIVTSRVFVDGEKGITAAKLNDIVASSVIQPAFYTSKPTASTADPTDIALILKAGAYSQVPVSTLSGSLSQALIWSTRLRSYNSLGNCNFEVDQRTAGLGVGAPISGQFVIDRWGVGKIGTMVLPVGQGSPGGGVSVPGTNFKITSKYLNIGLTTQQASLGVGDVWDLFQYVEGPSARELLGDISSISLLVSSSVVGLKFAVTLRDVPVTQSLTTLCTVPAAGFNLIQIPNIPAFPSGNFSNSSGAVGYQILICLACGANLIAPAAGTWQAGAFNGAPGMDNFASKSVNSTFTIAFIQHEPGPVCSTPMDLPFSANLDQCLRYFQKTYDLGVALGAITTAGIKAFLAMSATTTASGPLNFHKPMAKAPTVVLYDHNNGAANSVMDGAAVHHTGASAVGAGQSGFYGINFTTATASLMPVYCHYTSDTGW